MRGGLGVGGYAIWKNVDLIFICFRISFGICNRGHGQNYRLVDIVNDNAQHARHCQLLNGMIEGSGGIGNNWK